MSNTVKWNGWLTVGVNNPKSPVHSWRTTGKLSVGKPSTSGFEAAVKIQIELPASLFIRPQLEAKITVPAHSVTPLTIDLETLDNVEKLISQQTGFDVKLLPVDGKEDA